MRLSSVAVAAVLLFSSTVFAQHSSSSSSSSAGSNASSYHSSAPSGPSPSSSPSPSGSPSFSSSHVSAPSPVSEPAASHSAARPSEPAAGRIDPEPKLPGTEGKIVPSPRIGEVSAAREQERKAPESDLRRPVCKDAPCKETAPKPPNPAESDLRRPVPICKNPPCPCPPGETHGKHGACVASTAMNNP